METVNRWLSFDPLHEEGYRRLMRLRYALGDRAGALRAYASSEFVNWVQAQGADVLVGRALQTGRQLPYQPFIDILRHRLESENAPDDLFSDVWLAELTRLLPELRDRYPDLPAPAADEELGRHHLFEATARLIQKWAARRPLLLLLDDMQWADTATLDLVLYLAQRLADAGRECVWTARYDWCRWQGLERDALDDCTRTFCPHERV